MMNKIKTMKISVILLLSYLITAISVADDIKIIELDKSEIKTENTASVKTTEQPQQLKPELKVLYKTQNLTPEAALIVAQAAMKNCRDSGYQVSVAILDKGGNIQVLLRDRLAGIKTPDIAILKATTALSFKSATSVLTNSVLENKHLEGVTDIPGVLFLAGGITIAAAGSIIGSIGVSGAPDSKFDERCAMFGLKPIEGLLEFAD
ncbi:MAG: heme-binding protein [Gammaproteobacteria bacterium]